MATMCPCPRCLKCCCDQVPGLYAHECVNSGVCGCVIHRWQPTGYTPCGIPFASGVATAIVTNAGFTLNERVTCRNCLRATTRVILVRIGEIDG